VQQNKIKYGTLITAIFIFGLLLLPAITVIHHALTNHTSLVCDSDNSAHYHQSEFHCEFNDVVLNQYLYLPLLSITWSISHNNNKIDLIYFDAKISSQRPYFSLRAPPVAI
jgi:hypothetical protein